MNTDSKFKSYVSAQVGESLIVNAIRAATNWLYKCFIYGFIGTLFTSFTAEEELFKRGITGFGARRRRGRETIYKRLRRRVARGFERSALLSLLDNMVESLLSSNLRIFGAFGIIFGIYTILMFAIKAYALQINADVSHFIAGGIVTLLSIPMLYSGKPLAKYLREGLLARTLFYSVLRMHETKFTPRQQKSVVKYNAAVILGMIFGFMTYFVSPIAILAVVAVVVICAVILYQPEAGILGLIITAPFLSILAAPTTLLAAGVCVTTVSYLIKYMRGKRTMRSGISGAFIALFGIITLLGGIISAGGSESFEAAMMYTVLMLGYFLTVNLMRTRESCRYALTALTVSMVIVALYGVFQYMFGGLTLNWLDGEMFSYIPGRATSFFANPNVLGCYLIMFIPMLIVMAIYMRGFKKKFLLMFSLSAAVLCLVWTWSRGAWLGCIFGIIIFFLIFSRKTPIVLLAAVLGTPLAGVLLPGGVTERFMSIGNMADSSTYYRVYTWRGVLRMLREIWHSGAGVGQAAFEQLYPVFAYAGTEASPHAHNLTMQILSETGIAGLVTLLIVIFLFAQNCFEFIKNSTGEDRHIVTAGLTGIISILIMGMFDHIWYNYRVFFLFWILLALTVAYIASARSERAGVYEKMGPDTAEISLYMLK